MGKKGRKTRWRTLTITDEHSDSEESNTTTSGHRLPKGYPHKSYYSRFTYSSQSTPTRRYQCDGTKSTRSSSTASENKITFNEDEYTRITTPRQDVLFKKGYLNKPKTYQTQTSTGNSTTSTGNSTGNGTPDHQSTDLEYESQFVFPNGFVDQNGIYYINSFEPYPVMVYNPPTYYQEFTSIKAKRCSTGSLTESTSPNNEETSQSETPEVNPVYNVVYPNYYGVYEEPQNGAINEPEPRRVKKRRRRKPSRSKEGTTTSESSDEEDEEEEEEKVFSEKEELEQQQQQQQKTYDLKPDAEEFVPRAYRQQPPETIPMEAGNVHFIKIPSNFVPVPILSDFNAFIPPGIPINFIPQNFINYVPLKPAVQSDDGKATTDKLDETVKEITTVEVPKNQIDIAKIVSKLEEAAKEQDKDETTPNHKVKKRHRYQKVELKKPPSSPTEPLKPPLRNYSETLKRIPIKANERSEEKKPLIKEIVKNHRIEQTPQKVTNEWISVSSRKKRKNKNVEEIEDFEEPPIPEAPPLPEEQQEKVEPVVIIEPPPLEPVVQVIVEEEKKVKKKTKKHTKVAPPPITKRVIIKDVDLSVEEVKEEPKPVVEEPPIEEIKTVEEKPVEEIVENKKESPEKKTKKKKKKVVKATVLNSQSSSNTTLNVTDDSYDFLMDESMEKTNVEVSQELDKLIQRGMYNNLEEKIKSMNIESNDNFFKSIISNISNSREPSVEKTYIKTPDLSKILTNQTLLKPQTFDRKPGDFLGETTTPKPLGGGSPSTENLYPITKAVKEWMSKTRETTPEIELLKSPSEIFREFTEREDDDDVTTSDEESRTVQMGKYPKHGNLPYRAICCSIM